MARRDDGFRVRGRALRGRCRARLLHRERRGRGGSCRRLQTGRRRRKRRQGDRRRFDGWRWADGRAPGSHLRGQRRRHRGPAHAARRDQIANAAITTDPQDGALHRLVADVSARSAALTLDLHRAIPPERALPSRKPGVRAGHLCSARSRASVQMRCGHSIRVANRLVREPVGGLYRAERGARACAT